MSLIITFMFEPAKLQMNWARASGRMNARAEPTQLAVAKPGFSGVALTGRVSDGSHQDHGGIAADGINASRAGHHPNRMTITSRAEMTAPARSSRPTPGVRRRLCRVP